MNYRDYDHYYYKRKKTQFRKHQLYFVPMMCPFFLGNNTHRYALHY